MKITAILFLFVSISINGAAQDSPKDRFDKAWKESRSIAFQIKLGEQAIRKLAEDPSKNSDDIIALSRIVDTSKRGWLRGIDNVAQLFMTVPAEKFARPWAELKREWDSANHLHQQKNDHFNVLQNSVSQATKLFVEKRQHMQCASAEQMRKAWGELQIIDATKKNVERKIVCQLESSLLKH